MAGRGPTSFCQAYDEMAHVVASGANRAAEDVYAAATPSLDQFGKDAFIIEPSSPWQMLGQFYVNYCNSLLMDDESGEPVYPEMLMIQLASWEIYEDWEIAHTIPVFPEGARLSQPLAERLSCRVIEPGTVEMPRRLDALNAVGAIQGGAVATALDGTGVADTGTPSKTLYPYKNTVFPLDLKAPLVQWEQGTNAATAVKVALRYQVSGEATPRFSWSKIYNTEPKEGTLVTTAPAWQIPQEI